MTSVITTAEVKNHNNRDSLWMIIHGDVYDVSKFLAEHPGGEDTLLDSAGRDATDAFEDVGHSEDARQLMKKYRIGTLPDDEKAKGKKPVKACQSCCKLRSPLRKNSQCSSASRKNSRTECNSASRKNSRTECNSASRKNSRTECNSASSCLAVNTAPPQKPGKCWRTFDNPSPGSQLSCKSSKTTRFVVPPDKCDEEPTSTAAVNKVICDSEKSNWKWYALAAIILSAVAAGVMALKRR